MEPWKRFIKELKLTDRLEEIYFHIRLIFQREKWSDEDLSSPPYYPEDLMRFFQEFSEERDTVFKTIREYGFDVGSNDLANYLQIGLKNIDNMTPLNN